MSGTIDEIIAQDGFARVIVSLSGNGAAARKSGRDITKYFQPVRVWQSDSGSGLLESAMAVGASQVRSSSSARKRAASPTMQSEKLRVYPLLGLAIGTVTQEGAAGLRQDAAVSEMIPVEQPRLIRPVHAEPVAAAAVAALSWGVKKLRAPELWAQGITGKGVIVGHVDTGVDGKHPALKKAIHAFARLELNGDLTEGVKPFDTGDHGTHTAGTIVGRPGAWGSFGVAPGAKLASAMVIEGGDVITRIIGGIEWALEQGARIVSASLGLPGTGPAFRVLINGIRANGALPIFAVGNEGPNTSRYPGNYNTVLSIGAVEEPGGVAWFSGSQKFGPPARRRVPDLCAPGMGVISCIPGGQFASMDGTSMATPHVAGIAALLLSAEPSASLADIETAIIDSCIAPAGWNAELGGKGVPDAVQALALLRGTSAQAA